MGQEEWMLEFVEKGGARTLLSKLSQQLPLRTDVEVDYLSALTGLMLRYYRDEPNAGYDDPEARRRLANDLISTLSRLCRSIKERSQQNYKESEPSE